MKNVHRMLIVRDYHIVFEKLDNQRLWRCLMPKARFTHCEAIGRDSFSWVIVRPVKASIMVITTCVKASEDITKLLDVDANTAIVKSPKFKRRGGSRVILFAPWTCVEACKSLINLGCWYIVTPDQLHEYLILGGKVSFKWKLKNIMYGLVAHIAAFFYMLYKMARD